MLRTYIAIPLWIRVVSGLLLGVALGVLSPHAAASIAVVGEVFVRLFRMLVAPIVLVTIAAGIAQIGDPARLGKVGGRAFGLFLFTTACAVAIGMLVGEVLKPGLGVRLATSAAPALRLGPPPSAHDLLVGIVPTNIFEALAKGEMLPIIFFSVMIGLGTILAGEAGKPVSALLSAASRVLLQVVRVVMEATPFGVLALVSNAVATNGAAVFVNVGWLLLAVAIGAIVQMLVVHGSLLLIVARRPPLRFFKTIIDALVIAFSTASSAATLPVAIRIAEEDLAIPSEVAQTVLPLGASIGKDGTAMYVGLLGMFSLQALGVPATGATVAIMFVAAVLAAFGTAPVPSASLFMLASVLSAGGVPAEHTALVVAFILPFDRILDMTRTVPSASANLTVAAAVAPAGRPLPDPEGPVAVEAGRSHQQDASSSTSLRETIDH